MPQNPERDKNDESSESPIHARGGSLGGGGRLSCGSDQSLPGSPGSSGGGGLSSLMIQMMHTATSVTSRSDMSDTEDVSEDESGSARSGADFTPPRRLRAMLKGEGGGGSGSKSLLSSSSLSAMGEEGISAVKDEFDRQMAGGKQMERERHLHGAERRFQRALRVAHVIDATGMEVGVALNSLGGVTRKLGKLAEAEKLYGRALVIYETCGAEAGEIAAIVNNMAALAGQLDRFDDALAGYERALTLLESTVGRHSVYGAVTLNNMAHLEKKRGRLTEAIELYARAVAIADSCRGEEAKRVKGRTLNNMGQLYRKAGDLARAQDHFEQALHVWRSLKVAEHSTVSALSQLASLCVLRERIDEAISYHEEAIQMMRSSPAGLGVNAVPTLADLADLLKRQRRFNEAERQYRVALALLSAESANPNHPQSVQTLSDLASLLRRMGKSDEAGMLLARAMKIADLHLPPTHAAALVALRGAADLHAERGEHEKAAELYEKAITNASSTLGSPHPHVVSLREQLASIQAAIAINAMTNKLGSVDLLQQQTSSSSSSPSPSSTSAAARAPPSITPPPPPLPRQLIVCPLAARGMTSAVRSIVTIVEYLGQSHSSPSVSPDKPVWEARIVLDLDNNSNNNIHINGKNNNGKLINIGSAVNNISNNSFNHGNNNEPISFRVVGKRLVGHAKIFGTLNVYPKEVIQSMEDGKFQRWYPMWKVKGSSMRQSKCELCLCFMLP